MDDFTDWKNVVLHVKDTVSPLFVMLPLMSQSVLVIDKAFNRRFPIYGEVILYQSHLAEHFHLQKS